MLFVIVTAVVLAAVSIIDSKGRPFLMDKEHAPLKVLGVIHPTQDYRPADDEAAVHADNSIA